MQGLELFREQNKKILHDEKPRNDRVFRECYVYNVKRYNV